MARESLRVVKFLVVAVVALTLGFSGVAFGQRSPRFLWGDGPPRYLVIPGGDAVQARQQAAAGTNVPLWSSSFTYQGTTDPYTMVGTDPVCVGTRSAATLVLNSPIFQDFAFSPGGTNVGTTQYVDAFQRTNFWSAVSTTSPNCRVRLTNTVAPSRP